MKGVGSGRDGQIRTDDILLPKKTVFQRLLALIRLSVVMFTMFGQFLTFRVDSVTSPGALN
jgi:hypothetical protein